MGVQSKPSVRQELLAPLHGSSKLGASKRKKRADNWKHKLVCLARQGQDRPALRECEKDELFAAGLGEKEIEFDDMEAAPEEFQEILFEAFPQLQDGGGYHF